MRMRIELQRRYVEQAVASLTTVDPAGLLEVVRKDDERAQGFEQVADLVPVRRPWLEFPFCIEIHGIGCELIKQ